MNISLYFVHFQVFRRVFFDIWTVVKVLRRNFSKFFTKKCFWPQKFWKVFLRQSTRRTKNQAKSMNSIQHQRETIGTCRSMKLFFSIPMNKNFERQKSKSNRCRIRPKRRFLNRIDERNYRLKFELWNRFYVFFNYFVKITMLNFKFDIFLFDFNFGKLFRSFRIIFDFKITTKRILISFVKLWSFSMQFAVHKRDFWVS